MADFDGLDKRHCTVAARPAMLPATMLDEPSESAGESWLTLHQASAQSGRHIGALRSLVRRSRIPARKSNRGQWLVQLPDWLLARPAQQPARSPANAPNVTDLLAEIADLREQVGMATGQLAAKDEVIALLREDLVWHRLPWWRRVLGR
jgi:hypothetical protein